MIMHPSAMPPTELTARLRELHEDVAGFMAKVREQLESLDIERRVIAEHRAALRFDTG
jgi:hypothetical protein